MTKIYKLTVFVVDHQEAGIDDITTLIEQNRYFSPIVGGVHEREVEWSDDHPINKTATMRVALHNMFMHPQETKVAGAPIKSVKDSRAWRERGNR